MYTAQSMMRWFFFFIVLSVCSYKTFAQTIQVSAIVEGTENIFDNGSTTNIPSDFPFNSMLPLSVKISNTSATTPLVLTLTTGIYVALKGSGASDFSIDESSLTGTIAAGGNQSFVINLSPSATNGDKSVKFTIKSNDPSVPIYVGTITYTFSGVETTTGILNASDIGLSIYPNPSNDGHFHVKADNIDVNRVVVSNMNGVTEEFSSGDFNTTLKGLLLIRLYTNKGIVSEKIMIQ